MRKLKTLSCIGWRLWKISKNPVTHNIHLRFVNNNNEPVSDKTIRINPNDGVEEYTDYVTDSNGLIEFSYEKASTDDGYDRELHSFSVIPLPTESMNNYYTIRLGNTIWDYYKVIGGSDIEHQENIPYEDTGIVKTLNEVIE